MPGSPRGIFDPHTLLNLPPGPDGLVAFDLPGVMDARLPPGMANAFATGIIDHMQAWPLPAGCRRRDAALHEAGHAVVGFHTGRRPESAVIWRHHPTQFWGGNVKFEGGIVDSGESPDAEIASQALICIAGRESEKLFLKGDFWEGSSADELYGFLLWCNAVAVRTGGSFMAVYDGLLRQCHEILHARAPAVQRIAAKFMRKRRLNQVELVRAMAAS